MSTEKRLAAFVIGLLLGIYTLSKLHDMAMIRKWMPGATSYQAVVTGKQHSIGSRGSEYNDVNWKIENVSGVGSLSGEDQISSELWDRLREGSLIEVVSVGNPPHYYAANTIFADTGNYAFDICLLIAEFSGILCGLTLLIPKRSSSPKGSPSGTSVKIIRGGRR